MTGWAVDPAGVAATLASVREKSIALGAVLTPVPEGFEGLVFGCAELGSVVVAVQSVLDPNVVRLDSVSARIAAGAAGASLATDSYVQGDEQMAATAQRAAMDAASSGDLSFFGLS